MRHSTLERAVALFAATLALLALAVPAAEARKPAAKMPADLIAPVYPVYPVYPIYPCICLPPAEVA